MRRLSASIVKLDLQTNRSSNVSNVLVLKLVILLGLTEQGIVNTWDQERGKKKGMVALRKVECLPKGTDQTEDAPTWLCPEVL